MNISHNKKKELTMKYLYKICLIFLIIGGINWGLVGLFNFNLVTFITMGENIYSTIIYVFIAICGIIDILILFVKFDNQKQISMKQVK
jgi:hypothetical protein